MAETDQTGKGIYVPKDRRFYQRTPDHNRDSMHVNALYDKKKNVIMYTTYC